MRNRSIWAIIYWGRKARLRDIYILNTHYMDHFLFTSQMSGSLESEESQANPALSKIIDALQAMYDLFYDMNRRDITLGNLAVMERDLRSTIKAFDMSADEALDHLRQTRNKLDLAADILDQPRFSLHLQKQLYQYYDEICVHLNASIRILQNT